MGESMKRILSFMEKEGPRVHALLVRLTLCESVAEDLMQELFLKLSRSQDFAHSKNPPAYAFRSAIHLAFDWRRSQKRNPLTALPNEEMAIDET